MIRGRRVGIASRVLPRGCLAAALVVCACSSPEGTNPCGPASAEVVEVIDGDTVVIAGGEKVRYLMVNTTEITGGKDECYGTEARDYNKSLVLNRTVTLAYDVECRDRYGRLLAYVTVNGREVNTLLVERGFACVMHIAPNGDARVAEFNALQADAKALGRGVWGACSPVPCL